MASRKFDIGLLKQEVLELTDLLRHEAILEDLRALLLQSGIDPQKVLLAGFIEGKDGFEGGVLISAGGEVYHFERMVSESDFSVFTVVDDASSFFETYPALPVALEMEVP